MVGNMWGLKPKMALWIYTAIVRPTVTYAGIVWWEKTNQKNVQRKLNKLQRLACLMILGCLNLTPTASTEALIDIPPLHLFIKHDAMDINLKFKCSEYIEIRNLFDKSLNVANRQYEALQCSFTDECLRRYVFRKKFNVSERRLV